MEVPDPQIINPAKQGLKLFSQYRGTDEMNPQIINPAKQGLKQDTGAGSGIKNFKPQIINPAKQGLKHDVPLHTHVLKHSSNH